MMIMPILMVVVGTAGLSALATYCWWLSERVWRLRSDLFSIRDALWLRMLERGASDDPDHREFRDGINAVIRVAPHLSVFTFYRLLLDLEELRHLSVDEDAFIEGQVRRRVTLEVAASRMMMCQRIASFLLTETISGWIVYLASKPLSIGHDVQTTTAYQVSDMIRYEVFERYNEDFSPIARETVGSA